MHRLLDIKEVEPTEVPTEPVVPCLECGKDFVWWVHPIQACDDCVEKMMDAAAEELTRENLCTSPPPDTDPTS